MQTVREAMHEGAITCELDTPLDEAAREMRDSNVGSLIAVQGGEIKGIVTDRDIVTRAVAQGASCTDATVGDVCTSSVTTIEPSDSLEKAIQLARSSHVRRLPVVEGGAPVGVISLRDLAISA